MAAHKASADNEDEDMPASEDAAWLLLARAAELRVTRTADGTEAPAKIPTTALRVKQLLVRIAGAARAVLALQRPYNCAECEVLEAARAGLSEFWLEHRDDLRAADVHVPGAGRGNPDYMADSSTEIAWGALSATHAALVTHAAPSETRGASVRVPGADSDASTWADDVAQDAIDGAPGATARRWDERCARTCAQAAALARTAHAEWLAQPGAAELLRARAGYAVDLGPPVALDAAGFDAAFSMLAQRWRLYTYADTGLLAQYIDALAAQCMLLTALTCDGPHKALLAFEPEARFLSVVEIMCYSLSIQLHQYGALEQRTFASRPDYNAERFARARAFVAAYLHGILSHGRMSNVSTHFARDEEGCHIRPGLRECEARERNCPIADVGTVDLLRKHCADNDRFLQYIKTDGVLPRIAAGTYGHWYSRHMLLVRVFGEALRSTFGWRFFETRVLPEGTDAATLRIASAKLARPFGGYIYIDAGIAYPTNNVISAITMFFYATSKGVLRPPTFGMVYDLMLGSAAGVPGVCYDADVALDPAVEQSFDQLAATAHAEQAAAQAATRAAGKNNDSDSDW